MKKYFCCIFVGLAFLFLSSECKKKAIDRRNKYTGNWLFHYTVKSTSTGNAELITSGDYGGKIFYDGRKDKKHSVHFEFGKDWEEEFEIDKNEALIQCEKRGQFASEKIDGHCRRFRRLSYASGRRNILHNIWKPITVKRPKPRPSKFIND